MYDIAVCGRCGVVRCNRPPGGQHWQRGLRALLEIDAAAPAFATGLPFFARSRSRPPAFPSRRLAESTSGLMPYLGVPLVWIDAERSSTNSYPERPDRSLSSLRVRPSGRLWSDSATWADGLALLMTSIIASDDARASMAVCCGRLASGMGGTTTSSATWYLVRAFPVRAAGTTQRPTPRTSHFADLSHRRRPRRPAPQYQ